MDSLIESFIHCFIDYILSGTKRADLTTLKNKFKEITKKGATKNTITVLFSFSEKESLSTKYPRMWVTRHTPIVAAPVSLMAKNVKQKNVCTKSNGIPKSCIKGDMLASFHA
jgi:hypothetical protein